MKIALKYMKRPCFNYKQIASPYRNFATIRSLKPQSYLRPVSTVSLFKTPRFNFAMKTEQGGNAVSIAALINE